MFYFHVPKHIRDNDTVYSLMPDACKTFRHASLHIKPPITCRTTFAAVQADRGRPLSSRLSIHCCRQFYSATYPCWLSSTFYAAVPVVSRRKRNPGCWISPGCATLCYDFDEVKVNRCI